MKTRVNRHNFVFVSSKYSSSEFKMVNSCCAYGCTNRFKKGGNIRFHKFPLKNEILMKKWVLKIRRKNFTPTKTSVICSQHFSDSDYDVRPNTSRSKLKPDAFPSIFTAFPDYYQSKLKKSRVSVIHNLHEKATIKCSSDKDVAMEIECRPDEDGAIECHLDKDVAIECNSDKQATIECSFDNQLNSKAEVLSNDQLSNLFSDAAVQMEILSCDVGVQTEIMPVSSSPRKKQIVTLQKKIQVLDQKVKIITNILKFLKDLKSRCLVEDQTVEVISL